MVIVEKNSDNQALKLALGGLSRLVSITVFPCFLAIELVFIRIPKMIFSIPVCKMNDPDSRKKFYKKVERIEKFALGILFSPLGVRSPDSVSGLFLKMPAFDKNIRPFGVEDLYGKKVNKIHYPKNAEAIQELVQNAEHICVIGAGMSQGPQTVPADSKQTTVINTKYLNTIEFAEDNQTVKVGAGATWEQIQVAANQRGKSVIVKQASDIFSVGGSIGINCHGWAHEYGAISSTVESLEIIDSQGQLQTLTPDDELFGCIFGTMGYFGVIVSATLKITDNENLIEQTEEVELDEFVKAYQEDIKDHNYPLFGGRLNLDTLEGEPLRQVCMVRYAKENKTDQNEPLFTEQFTAEAKFGTRMERIALQALSHLDSHTSRRLISYFWSKERQRMLSGTRLTRNEALHPPINAFMMLHKSNLRTQWLQEYFIKEENLANFLRFLGAKLKANDVRVINATIRPTPQDNISVLPYAEQDRYAVVICFEQLKTKKNIKKTEQWIRDVNAYLTAQGDVYYQAYMPFATQEEFEKCYGPDRIERLRRLKQKYDPNNVFRNGHTAKYYDKIEKNKEI